MRWSRFSVLALAAATSLACHRPEATTPPDDACGRIRLRSTRLRTSLRHSVKAIAAVPEGTWILHPIPDGRRHYSISLYDDRGRLRRQHDLSELLQTSDHSSAYSIASNGHVLGVLAAPHEHGNTTLTTVSVDGQLATSPPLQEPGGFLNVDADGHFVVFSPWSLRTFDGVDPLDDHRFPGPPEDFPYVHTEAWTMVSTARGHVMINTSDEDSPYGVGVRWIDDQGSVLAQTNLLPNERAYDPSAVEDDRGVAIVYGSPNGPRLARVGEPGQVLMFPTVLDDGDRRRHKGDKTLVAYDDGHYWMTGAQTFAMRHQGHAIWHYRSRTGVFRMTTEGVITTGNVMPSVFGSRYDPIMTLASDGIPRGIYRREVWGTLGNRHDRSHVRLLSARCAR